MSKPEFSDEFDFENREQVTEEIIDKVHYLTQNPAKLSDDRPVSGSQ